MLVLTRKVGGQIAIGNEMIVTVVAVRGRQVRLGIKAPKDVSIGRRKEDGDLPDVPAPGEAASGGGNSYP